MFKEGDYIVTLEGDFTIFDGTPSAVAKKNFIFQQHQNDNHLHVKTLFGTIQSNFYFTFNKKEKLKDWRYATPQEIEEYNRLGKPYDVTTLVSKEPNYEIF